MAGGNPSKSSSHTKPSFPPPSSHRKSRWESSNSTANPNPHPNSNPNPNSKSNPKPSSDSNPKTQSHPSTSSKPSPKPKPRPGPSPTSAHPKTSLPPPHHAPSPSFSLPDPGPPPPPSYGFHMLERRTISLADGSVRSYFALPPEYHDSPPPRPLDPTAARFFPGAPRPEFGLSDREDPFLMGRQSDFFNPLGPESGRASLVEGQLKRRFGDEELDKARKRQQVLQYGNDPDAGLGGWGFRGGPSEELRGSNSNLRNGRLKHAEVDQVKLKKAYLQYTKAVNENANQKKNYIDNGKNGSLKCIACGRSSKDFPDMHALIMHTYYSENVDMLVDHLGLHKALCVLMGWNYSMPPDNSKAYQGLSAEEAATNREDLIMWPPMVVIHNTVTGKIKDGRVEGLGNKAMDAIIRELGFSGGKSKSLYGRDGHLGITMIKFSGDQAGLREAMQMAEHFVKENHGRKGWTRLQPLTLDDDNNPNLVRVDARTGEKKRIFYGYLATASDLDKLDFETRKKVVIESRRDQLSLS